MIFSEAGAEPTGRLNTERMITEWNAGEYGEQDERDVWGVIQEEVADGWFVPSKSEWSAFGAKFNITGSNYLNLGLGYNYWSSSQSYSNRVYYALCDSGNIFSYNVDTNIYVRLATTF